MGHKGVPHSDRHRNAIRDAQLLLQRERRAGQLMSLVAKLRSGELTEIITREIEQAACDWESKGQLSGEQVSLLNRLSSLVL